ncbi:unnamed protein product [Blumeria hordei]|nr:unnamed protein product [Blumeria hordei]
MILMEDRVASTVDTEDGTDSASKKSSIPVMANNNHTSHVQNNAGLHTSDFKTSNNHQNPYNRPNQFPSEISHITHGYLSLQKLIARLAQKTHSDLLGTIKDLAQLPLPTSKLSSNGSTVTMADDNSVENLTKKLRVLKFATDAHEAWTKALVITGWSRKADDVSKIIDLKVHLDQKQNEYVAAIEQMAHDKKGYIHARLPNPDIKTALEVLVTGKVSWMPEFGYITPPPLTSQEILRTLEQLNTLLAIRLNLDEYNTVPYHFKNFHIRSGRVTFTVAGEFELDLTIAEEAPQAQYWFLDLRFKFSPSLKVIDNSLRYFLESRINSILLQDGLNGCYNFLHDLTLTYKIGEFRRQAIYLARYRWVHSAKVEALNRSTCIQYWIDRFHRAPKTIKAPKSWLILGVHSGKSKNGRPNLKATRKLGIRWFRDNKEQKDVEISIDDVNISAEALLTAVVSKHIAYILTSIYQNLKAKPLYAKCDLSLCLSISNSDSAKSNLKVQLTTENYLTIKIEPISGLFVFEPPTRKFLDYQRRLNTLVIDPAARAHEHIELLRYSLLFDNLLGHGWTTGWKNIRNPGVNILEMKRVFTDAAQVLWFRRSGWPENWYLTISMNMAGENWRLVQTTMTIDPTNPNGMMIISTQIKMPIKVVSPVTNYSFMITCSIFSAALISYYENLKTLWSQRIVYTLTPSIKSGPLKLPHIYIKSSEILTSQNVSSSTGNPWAKDAVRLSYHGLESAQPVSKVIGNHTENSTKNSKHVVITKDTAVMVAEIRIMKPIPRPLLISRKLFGKNTAFHSNLGSFAFRLRSYVGESVISSLVQSLDSLELLVECIQVLERHEGALKCESISLERIDLAYRNGPCVESITSLSSNELVYKAAIVLNPKGKKLDLQFRTRNPHIRVADHLNNLLNSSQGLHSIATILPLTIQILCEIENIEDTWAASMRDHGTVIINARAVDWYVIRYKITKYSTMPHASRVTRTFLFDTRLCQRQGEAWWHIRRRGAYVSDDFNPVKKDDLDQLLIPLWQKSGNSWQGMRSSAVAKCEGIAELLQNLDQIIQSFAKNGATWSHGKPQKAQTASMISFPPNRPLAPLVSTSIMMTTAPTATMRAGSQLKQIKPQQNKNLSTQNTNASHGVVQTRNNLIKREIVEID